MRKVSLPKKRAGKTGWWVSWFENGKRKFRSFPTKALAGHFQHLQYHRLNSDVFISSLDVPWDTIRSEFLQTYDVNDRAKATKDIARIALDRFHKSTLIKSSAQITQKHVDAWVLDMQKSGFSPSTINRDIQRIKSFLAWMKRSRYTALDFEIEKRQVIKEKVTALTTDQIRGLLSACESLAWQVRILLSLCTGLRRDDIDHAGSNQLNLPKLSLSYVADKTGKHGTAPLPERLRPILERYAVNLNGRIFDDGNVRKEWENIRLRAGLYTLKEGPEYPKYPSKRKKNIIYLVDRQDFRRTFSTLVQKTSGLSSAQQLLQHSSEKVTLEHYTDMDLILAWRVNQLPVDEWLEGVKIHAE